MGDPIPLARPRLGKNGRVYDSQYKDKAIWMWDARLQAKNMPLMLGFVHMSVEFIMPIAVSLSAKKRKELQETWHDSKPDLSNLLKFVEDVLIGIAYHDDSQVCKIECTKKYGLQPQTLVILTQIDPTGI